jgi:hypothetical protein
MRALEIPSIFRAVVKISGPGDTMPRSAEASMSKFERSLRSVSQSAFQTSRNTALMAVGIIAPMAVFANEAVKFESQMSNVATLIYTNKDSIKGMGDEVLKIKAGSFKCHKFVPVVQTGRVFKSEKDLNFWVTADENKIPILVKAKIPVGYVKLHLVCTKSMGSSYAVNKCMRAAHIYGLGYAIVPYT